MSSHNTAAINTLHREQDCHYRQVIKSHMLITMPLTNNCQKQKGNFCRQKAHTRNMQMAWKCFIGCNAFFILVEVFVQWQEEKDNPSGLFPMQEVEVLLQACWGNSFPPHIFISFKWYHFSSHIMGT